MRRKKHQVHFAHGFLADSAIFVFSKKHNISIHQKASSLVSAKTTLNEDLEKCHIQTANNISQVCCPHFELIPYVYQVMDGTQKTEKHISK